MPDRNVQLCHKHIIGNITTENFEDIWFGKEAYSFRKKIMSKTDICRSCNYWLLCINQPRLNTNNPNSHLINRKENIITKLLSILKG